MLVMILMQEGETLRYFRIEYHIMKRRGNFKGWVGIEKLKVIMNAALECMKVVCHGKDVGRKGVHDTKSCRDK